MKFFKKSRKSFEKKLWFPKIDYVPKESGFFIGNFFLSLLSFNQVKKCFRLKSSDVTRVFCFFRDLCDLRSSTRSWARLWIWDRSRVAAISLHRRISRRSAGAFWRARTRTRPAIRLFKISSIPGKDKWLHNQEDIELYLGSSQSTYSRCLKSELFRDRFSDS